MVSDCQSGCSLGFFFGHPFDEMVTVKFPSSEGTSIGSELFLAGRSSDLCVREISVCCMSGYTMPLPPTPRIRLIRGMLVTMRDRAETALETISLVLYWSDETYCVRTTSSTALSIVCQSSVARSCTM